MLRGVVTVSGGTGYVGRRFCEALLDHGYEVRILTTLMPENNGSDFQYHRWNPLDCDLDDLATFLKGSEAVVNLAGEPIAQRWTWSVRQRIFSSRLYSTSSLISAMLRNRVRPDTFLNMSSVDYYGGSDSEDITEEQHEGYGFLSRLYSELEHQTMSHGDLGIRMVIARSGMVVGAPSGPFGVYCILAKRGVVPLYGEMTRWLSWISVDDLSRALVFLLEKQSAGNIFNIVTKEPFRKTELMSLLSKLLDTPPTDEVTQTYGGLFKSELVRSFLFNNQSVSSRKIRTMGFRPKSNDIVREVTSKITDILSLTRDV